MELTGIPGTSRVNVSEDRGCTVEVVSWVLGRKRDRRKNEEQSSDAVHLK